MRTIRSTIGPYSSSYRLNIQHIKSTKNILAHCLSHLIDATLSECDYEPKGQEFGCTIFKDLPSSPIVKTLWI